MKHYLFITTIFFSVLAFAQDENVEENIKEISEQACTCISKIDINETKEVKSKEIKSCITTANMMHQFKESLVSDVSKAIDSLSKTANFSKIDSLTVGKGDNIIVNVAKNYKEIEKYLYDNCPAMKNLYFTDNKEYENSYSDRKKAMKFYDKGQVAFQKEEYEIAIVMFNKAVKKDKKFAFAWDNLGYSYRRIGNYKKAIESYKKSLALDPKGKMPLMNIAVAYQLDNDLENSKKAYETYKKFYNDDPEAFYGLGRIYYLEKDYESALENMIQAYLLYIEMDSPYNIDAQKHISFIYNELKEQENLELFNKIAKKYKLNVNTKN